MINLEDTARVKVPLWHLEHTARYVNNNFLRRDGSNDVQGELNMNNHKLVGLTEPTESQDAGDKGLYQEFYEKQFPEARRY